MVTQTGYSVTHSESLQDQSLDARQLRQVLVDEASKARNHLDPFSEPVRQNIIVAFLLYGCYIGLGNQRHAYYFIREATTLYTASALESQVSRSDGDDDSSLPGNLFWLLLVSERWIILLISVTRNTKREQSSRHPKTSTDHPPCYCREPEVS